MLCYATIISIESVSHTGHNTITSALPIFVETHDTTKFTSSTSHRRVFYADVEDVVEGCCREDVDRSIVQFFSVLLLPLIKYTRIHRASFSAPLSIYPRNHIPLAMPPATSHTKSRRTPKSLRIFYLRVAAATATADNLQRSMRIL